MSNLDGPIPTTVAVCPHCQGQLYLEVDEWDTETGIPTEAGVHVSCVNDEESPGLHYQMPYVWWLPLEMTVYQWIVREGMVVNV